MARKSRTNRSPELKAKVALAAVQGRHIVAQLASLHGVHPVQIAQWKKLKKQLVAGAAGVFATCVKTSDMGRTALEEELFARIGRLDMELEWLTSADAGQFFLRRSLLDPDHESISMRRQCELLGLPRSTA